MKNKKTLSQTILSGREDENDVGWNLIITIDREGKFKNYGTAFSFRSIKDDENYRKSGHGKKVRKAYNCKYFTSSRGREKIDKYQKSEKGIITIKKYKKTKKGKEAKKQAAKKYNGTKNGKRTKIVRQAKRRDLGFIPLNAPLDGINCDAHHISKENVIYIPTVIHNAIPHNLKTGKNMKLINSIAEGFK